MDDLTKQCLKNIADRIEEYLALHDEGDIPNSEMAKALRREKNQLERIALRYEQTNGKLSETKIVL